MTETKKASKLLALNDKNGAPGTIRTCDRLVRSPFGYSDSYSESHKNSNLPFPNIPKPTPTAPLDSRFLPGTETNLIQRPVGRVVGGFEVPVHVTRALCLMGETPACS